MGVQELIATGYWLNRYNGQLAISFQIAVKQKKTLFLKNTMTLLNFNLNTTFKYNGKILVT